MPTRTYKLGPDRSARDGYPGLVATKDSYDSRVSWGGHDELKHDAVVTYGASLDEDQEEALLRKLWWERCARVERAAEELLADSQDAAHRHAQAVSRISAENPAFDRSSVQVFAAPSSG